MQIQEEIYQILGQKLSDGFDSEKLVDWAIKLLMSKYESESLWILAGLNSDSIEGIEKYFWDAIEELGIDLKKETSDVTYAKYVAKSVLINKIKPKDGLNEMIKIYRTTKDKDKFNHFNEIELELSWMDNIGLPSGVAPKIPIDSLDEFLKNEFDLFLKYEELGVKRKFEPNQFHHNWEELLYPDSNKND